MRKKTKTMLLTIIAFCLCIACISFGVYAVQSASLKINTNIGYNMHEPIVNISGTIDNGSSSTTSQSFSRSVRCIEGVSTTETIFSFNSLSFVQSGSTFSDMEFSLQLENLDTTNDMSMQIELVSTLPTGVSVSTNSTYVQIPYEDGYLVKGSSSTLKFGFSSTAATTLTNFSIKFKFSPASELQSKTFPTGWKDEIATTSSTASLSAFALSASTLNQTSTLSMTTALSANSLTSIMFEKSAPAGYTKIGELSTGIRVYQSTTTSTDIAFVWGGDILAPEDCTRLFGNWFSYMNSFPALSKISFKNFNTANVTNMFMMFQGSSNITSLEYLTNFNTTSVQDMGYMFANLKMITSLDLSSFDMSNVTETGSMLNFYDDNPAITELKTPRITKSEIKILKAVLYYNNEKQTSVPAGLTQSITYTNQVPAAATFPTDWKTHLSNGTYMGLVFIPSEYEKNSSNLTKISFEKSAPTGYTKIGKLRNSISVYQNNTTSTDIAFVWGGTINAPENCSALFASLSSVTTFEFNNFDTTNTTNMSSMFNGCTALTSLDLSSFNMANVGNSTYMMLDFDCNNLQEFKTPYNNSYEITIDSNALYYNNELVTSVPAGLTQSITYTNVAPASLSFPTNWKTEMQDGYSYMGTVYYPTDKVIAYNTLTSIMFEKSAPAGYTKIGELSTGIRVYQSTTKLTDIAFVWGGDILAPEDCTQIFGTDNNNQTALTSITFNNFNTENVKKMNGMFNKAISLQTLDLTKFSTTNLTNMRTMFQNCRSLTSITFGSSFNTEKVTDMTGLFYYCEKLNALDITNFNTANVTNMSYMFNYCSVLKSLDLSNFNTAKVTDMSFMFNNCKELTSLNLSSFNTSLVENMKSMFQVCEKLSSITFGSNFNTATVSDMSFMFTFCSGLTSLDVSNFNTSNVENMEHMFKQCSSLNTLNVSSFNTSKVTSMDAMFLSCSSLTELSLTNFVTTSLQSDCPSMFYNCSGLKKLDLSSFDFSNITNHLGSDSMLNFGPSSQIEELKTPYGSTVALTITTGNTLYNSDTGLSITSVPANTTASLTYVNVAPATFDDTWKTQVASTDYMTTVITPSNITSIAFEKTAPTGYSQIGTLSSGIKVYQNTSNTNQITFVHANIIYAPQNSSYLFQNLSSLTNITFNNFKTNNVQQMNYMFASCYNLVNLDLGNFNTSNVQEMNYMLYGCSNLVSVDVSSFDTSSVTSIYAMFYYDSSITTLDLSNFNLTSVTSADGFSNMLYFGSSNHITQLKTPYNNKYSITITTGSTLYNDNEIVKKVLTNTTSSLTYTNTAPTTKTFDSNWKQQIASSAYMSTTLSTTEINIINFLDYVDYDYWNRIGTLNSGIHVYKYNNNSFVQIGFVWGSTIYAPTSCYELFKDLTGLSGIGFSNFNTSNTNNMYRLFMGCTSLTRINDLTNFNTANVTNMEAMFTNCQALTSVNVSSFNTEKVTDMAYMFQHCYELTSISFGSNFKTGNVTRMVEMFRNCKKITSLNLSTFNTANVTTMVGMFQGCLELVSVNVSSFNTKKVQNMNAMFAQCSKLEAADLSSFETPLCTDMAGMFNDCTNLESVNLSNFSNEKLTTIGWMFGRCTNLTNVNLTAFKTDNVTNLSNMFYLASGITNLDLSGFNLAKATNVSEMLNFDSSSQIKELKTPYGNTIAISITTGSTLYNAETGSVVTSIPANTKASLTYTNVAPANFTSNWKSQVASTSYMTTTVTPTNLTSIKFEKTAPSGYTQIGTISNNIKVYKSTSSSTSIAFVHSGTILAPTDCNHAFSGLTNITSIAFNNFSTANTTIMNDMFYNNTKLTSITFNPYFKTTKVTTMAGMFNNCNLLPSINLSTFSSEALTKCSHMFIDCNSLTSLSFSSAFTIEKVQEMQAMFENCSSLQTITHSFKTTLATNMSYMFKNCSALTSLSVSSFNTSKVTDMAYMFYNCSKLTSLSLSNFNTSIVTDMNHMFNFCSKLTSINLSSFNTSNVTAMNDMFTACEKLTTITFGSNFKTTKVITMAGMFNNCYLLSSINLSTFTSENLTIMSHMFQNNRSLTSISFPTAFTATKVTTLWSTFNGCIGLKTINVSSFNTANVNSMTETFNGCSSLTSLDLSNFNMTKVDTSNMNNMLNFGSSNQITQLKTPYNNKAAISITTGSTLKYNGSTVTSVPANITASRTYTAA